jgi:hypothetical protein
MIRRLARWYGISSGDLVTYGGSLVVVAAALATWFLVDEGAVLRAAAAFVGTLAIAGAPTLWRMTDHPQIRLAAFAGACVISFAIVAAAVSGNAMSGLIFGVVAGLAATTLIKRRYLREAFRFRRIA